MSEPRRAAPPPIRLDNIELSSPILDFRPKAAILPWPVPPPPEKPNLFLDDMAELRKDLAALAEQKRAENTKRAYEADWRSFESFCEKAKCASLPALPISVCLYVTYEARLGLSMATITRRLSAISAAHRGVGVQSPCTPDVGLVLADLRRKMGTAAHPKLPIWPDDLKAMLEAAGSGARALRDRALLLTGFTGGLRRSELVALDVGDVSSEPRGLRVHIGRSKTDKLGAGIDVGLPLGQCQATCPVRVLQEWIAVRGRQPGPLFCRVLKSGQVTGARLAGAAVARIVKRAAKSAGLEPALLSGHSMRRGCASSATAEGAGILAVKARLRHASVKMTERYVDYANVFAGAPIGGL